MTQRKRDLLKVLVRVLKKADGEPLEVVVLHFKMEPFFNPSPTLDEVNEALQFAQSSGMACGITTELEVQRWAITDKGRLAEL